MEKWLNKVCGVFDALQIDEVVAGAYEDLEANVVNFCTFQTYENLKAVVGAVVSRFEVWGEPRAKVLGEVERIVMQRSKTYGGKANFVNTANLLSKVGGGDIRTVFSVCLLNKVCRINQNGASITVDTLYDIIGYAVLFYTMVA